MAMNAEQMWKICSPSLVMVTSSYEWKILDWDEKPQTNKQALWKVVFSPSSSLAFISTNMNSSQSRVLYSYFG